MTYEEITYEGYGPGGAAILIEAMTDNKNRTTAEIRHLLTKYGGNMAAAGAVAFQFSKKGYDRRREERREGRRPHGARARVGRRGLQERTMPDVFEIITDPASFEAVKAAVEAKNIPIQTAEIQMVPQNTIDVADKAPALLKLLEMIEDNDDVQKVWSNGDIDEKYLTE